MMAFLAGDTMWVVALLTLALGLSVITAGLGWAWDVQRARLPDATRYDDVSTRLELAQRDLAQVEDRKRQLEQQVQDRDRVVAEVVALQQRLEALRAELAGLASAEPQIDDMKRRAAEAAAEFAAAKGALDDMRTARADAEFTVHAAERRLEAIQREIEISESQVKAAAARVDEVRTELANLDARRTSILREVAGLEEQRAKADEARAAMALLDTRKLNLQRVVADLEGQEATLGPRIAERENILHRLRDEEAAIAAALTELRIERDRLETARSEVAALDTRKLNLQRVVVDLEGQEATLRPRIAEGENTLQRLRDDQAALVAALTDLRIERDRLETARSEVAALLARKEALQATIDGLEQRSRGTLAETDALRTRLRGLADEQAAIEREISELSSARAALRDARDEAAALAAINATRARHADGGSADQAAAGPELKELLQSPICLRAKWPQAHPTELEKNALYRVTTHLDKLGLHYHDRTVRAFHTALKINDASQLTVLAGVSGTGKSLLPRRYAEAMGIRFLQIAVEPRWDSPQDLLGFYNYIEKGYRATDLARALVHMDPYQTAGLDVEPAADQMLLVLLDEMNLARVEYYFSEFLSRLEVRPLYKSDLGLDSHARMASSLPLDLPGRAEGPVRLFPSHNVLFAGTMNDDESTQSLSDKVLDRSNVLQFAAPTNFPAPGHGAATDPQPHYRSFGEWRKWVRPTGELKGGERDKAKQVVKNLAEILEGIGRPFGHRLNDAILAYVANYPHDNGTSIEIPLADQVEMRILPKLRGVPITDHQTSFDKLQRLVSDELHDGDLASRLRELVEQAGSGAGQFNWRGFSRRKG